jgi:cytochrome c oxidase subunit III
MTSDTIKQHPWHMVEPSPWPIIGTLAAFMTAVGLIFFMHEGISWLLYAGGGLLAVTFFGWFRTVVSEAEVGTHHTGPVQHGLRMGMLLFIASEVMFFVAFFWAYFHASMPALSFVASPVWPPEGVTPFDTWSIPFFNTLILLTSGATVTWAHHALRQGDRKNLIIGLFLTVALGIIFLGFQMYEYGHAAFGFKEGIYPSTFYMATGFHGFHVFVGTIFLIVCLFRSMSGHFKPDQHVGFEAAAWYWHFVDVVWLFLFIWVYWWGSYGYAG